MPSRLCENIALWNENETLPVKTPMIGVAGLITNTEGQVYTIRENNSKWITQKFKGMRSIPMETIEDGESLEDATRRMLLEEIGGLDISSRYQLTQNSSVGGFFVHPEVFVHIFHLHCYNSELSHGTGDDVKDPQWVSTREILHSKKYTFCQKNLGSLPDFLDPDVDRAINTIIKDMDEDKKINLGSLKWRPGTQESILALKAFRNRQDLAPSIATLYLTTLDRLPKQLFYHIPGSDLFPLKNS